MIYNFNGIAFGKESGTIFFAVEGVTDEGKTFTETPAPLKDFQTFKWAPWGTDNKHPLNLKLMIDNCGELQSIIKAKATFAINRGILPVIGSYNAQGEFEIQGVVDDDEVEDFIESSNLYDQCYSIFKDRYGYGNFVGRCLFNEARDKIIRIRRDDITEMRYGKLNAKNISDKVYLSAEWGTVMGESTDKVKIFDLLDLRRAQDHLKELAAKKKTQFAFTGREPDWNTKYYSDPDWYAARDWVQINMGVPKMKAAMYQNNMRPKYIVRTREGFFEKFVYPTTDGDDAKTYTPQERKALQNAFYDNVNKYLAGNENAYKSIFSEFEINPDGKELPWITIEAVEDKSIDGELLKDSSTSGSMIAFSMGWNPAINGGNLPSGPYTNSQGGSNVRESTLLQVMMAEPERQSLLHILNVIARYNGWTKKHKGFRWVIASTIPTTLDTGGSSKPGIEGVPNAK